MRLRRFTQAGLVRFEEFLALASHGEVSSVPVELLERRDFVEELGGEVEFEPALLGTTRLEAARYIDERLVVADIAEPGRDLALWAWLSALAFDVVTRRDRSGRYRPGARSSYIPVIADARKIHRHRLLGPYLIYESHRDDPRRALCLLSQPIARPGILVERLASRPRLVACPAVVGVATVLFCNRTGAIKRNAPARVDRLSDVLMQLDRTFDLYGMTTEALLELLPREFDALRSVIR